MRVRGTRGGRREGGIEGREGWNQKSIHYIGEILFSDPPHLLKTIRNCLANAKRILGKFDIVHNMYGDAHFCVLFDLYKNNIPD